MVTVATSTSSSIASLNGLSSGIDTTALIAAIMADKSAGVNRLTAQQTLNNQKTTALTSLSGELSGLTTSMAALQDKFNATTITSTDSSNAYVTATATGLSSGSFDVQVSTVATKARLSAKLDGGGNSTNLAVVNPGDSVGSSVFSTGTSATFALQGTDGKIYTISLDSSSNTLNGLRDKINAVAGSSVTASVVNTGKGANPYQLVITAKATGTGSTGGNVTLADVTANDGTTVANNLGIAAGTVIPASTGNGVTTPASIAGGLNSSAGNGAVATDANFTVNGISLTRSTNTVTDAVAGMTFSLKQGGQSGTTTLTIGQDVAGTTAALQDYITKYNQLVTDYHTASTATKNADGSLALAPLSGDQTTRALMSNIQATLEGASAGLSSSATYKSLASVGVTNQSNGTLYLNTYTFQNAMNTDPASVQSLFTFSGSSTSPAVTVKSGGSGPATVVLIHHSDTVGTDDYRQLAGSARNPAALAAALHAERVPLGQEAQDDLDSGAFLFGHGGPNVAINVGPAYQPAPYYQAPPVYVEPYGYGAYRGPRGYERHERFDRYDGHRNFDRRDDRDFRR